jgi:hypothetical protein
MRRFILNILLFFCIAVLLFYIKPTYLLVNDIYKNTVAGKEIYISILKSKQKKKSKKLILGDSVANQLFPNTKNNDTINSLACNQAVSLVGQYILLNNYINSGNKLDTVYLIFNPFSFRNNLNQEFTFHYFIKPFYTSEYKHLLSNLVYEKVHNVPFFYLAHEPYILTSNWAPDFKNTEKNSFTFLSDISSEYLQKIKKICINNNIKLRILPVPTTSKNKKLIQKFNLNEITNVDMNEEFKNYFSEIIYLDDSLFIDGTHLKKPSVYTDFYNINFLK